MNVPGRAWARYGAVAAFVLALAGPLQVARAAAPTFAVSVKSSVPSGQPVGTAVTWTASSTGVTSPVYRFSVVYGHGKPAVVRDFGPGATFTWAPMYEGTYQIQVTAKDGFTSSTTKQAETPFTIKSRVTGRSAVVTATANPLVALYSAPACGTGTMVVQFHASSSTAWQSTGPQTCVAGQSVNVLVSGMRASTGYMLRHVVGKGTPSVPLKFTTGKPEAGLKITAFTVKQAPIAQSDAGTPVIFDSLIPNPSPAVANPIATDLSGNLVWYYDSLRSGLTNIWPLHFVAGGTALLFGLDRYHASGDDVVREIDLAGNIVRETNIDVVNAQLVARGQEPIYMFHHEALRLPDGDTAVLGATQNRVSGHDVMSDMIVVLDRDFQVVWTWDMFDHFTPPATWPATTGVCSVLCALPDPKSFDWTHGNGLGFSATDGNLILSLRSLSWVIKVEFKSGHGGGKVLWTLGKGGDFTIKSSDPYPWFSLQHNATYVTPTSVVIFDDGNIRCKNGKVKGCETRGQVYTLDEQHHVATLDVNANLGSFWQALGSAEVLPNGNYTFAGGFPAPSREVEVSPKGVKVYELDTPIAVYRAYRLAGLS